MFAFLHLHARRTIVLTSGLLTALLALAFTAPAAFARIPPDHLTGTPTPKHVAAPVHHATSWTTYGLLALGVAAAVSAVAYLWLRTRATRRPVAALAS